MTIDLINHPKHYNSHPSGVEVINVARHLNFNMGNALKYLLRSQHKGSELQDLKKALWYLQDEYETLIHERWKLWPKDTRYEISNQGQVRTVNSGYMRKLVPIGRGYLSFNRTVDKKGKSAFVHRVVWETFQGPIPQGLSIRHLNGNFNDNRLSNLRPGTALENALDRRIHGTDFVGDRNGQAILSWEEVNKIRQTKGLSQTKIAEKYGVSQTTIGRILREEAWVDKTPEWIQLFRDIIQAEPSIQTAKILNIMLVSLSTGGPLEIKEAIYSLNFLILAKESEGL